MIKITMLEGSHLTQHDRRDLAEMFRQGLTHARTRLKEYLIEEDTQPECYRITLIVKERDDWNRPQTRRSRYRIRVKGLPCPTPNHPNNPTTQQPNK